MTHVHAERVIERDPEQTMRLFAGPIAGWLPVIVGPEEETWRAVTREGPIRVHVTIHAGDVWVLPDGTHRRVLDIQPDRTDFHYLLAAALTPRVQGELRLEPATDDTTRMVFDGQTRRRSRVTIALERLLIGDPLVRSGIDTLLDIITEQMNTATLDSPHEGPRHGPVHLPVPH